MRASLSCLLFEAIWLWASPARGCPLCESETGRRVREGIFGPEFGCNLFGTLLPFLAFLGLAAWIHGGVYPRAAGRRGPIGPGDSPALPPSTEVRLWAK
jgi:hypothetical protein